MDCIRQDNSSGGCAAAAQQLFFAPATNIKHILMRTLRGTVPTYRSCCRYALSLTTTHATSHNLAQRAHSIALELLYAAMRLKSSEAQDGKHLGNSEPSFCMTVLPSAIHARFNLNPALQRRYTFSTQRSLARKLLWRSNNTYCICGATNREHKLSSK